MASELIVQTLKGPTSGANANKIIVPSGQTLSAAGHVIQVANVHKSDAFSAASTYPSFVDVTGLSVTITPASTTSKFLILSNVSMGNNVTYFSYLRLMRDTTALDIGDTDGARAFVSAMMYDASNNGMLSKQDNVYLDSPATTSSITYKVQVASGGGTAHINRGARDSAATTYDARQASSLTVMEIAQ